MFVNRDAVPSDLHVIQYLPVPPLIETLQWTTKIFIAADLSETREAWVDVPATTIQYAYIFNLNTRALLQDAIAGDLLWMLPYFPYMSLVEDKQTWRPSFTFDYPYGETVAYISLDQIIYRNIDPINFTFVDTTPDRWGNFFDKTVWVCPCYTAYIDRNIRYTSLGRCRDGDNIQLTFRLTAAGEQQSFFETPPPYTFTKNFTVPYNITRARNQTKLNTKASVAYSFSPFAKQPDVAQQVTAKYFLRHDDEVREDYELKGAFNWAKGAVNTQDWINDQSFWRLADDKLVINYHRGYTEAMANLRKAF